LTDKAGGACSWEGVNRKVSRFSKQTNKEAGQIRRKLGGVRCISTGGRKGKYIRGSGERGGSAYRHREARAISNVVGGLILTFLVMLSPLRVRGDKNSRRKVFIVRGVREVIDILKPILKSTFVTCGKGVSFIPDVSFNPAERGGHKSKVINKTSRPYPRKDRLFYIEDKGPGRAEAGHDEGGDREKPGSIFRKGNRVIHTEALLSIGRGGTDQVHWGRGKGGETLSAIRK
jgi:hypothetical protein